jgi:hypothetical protein
MRQEEIWDAEAAQRYDTPGTDMFAPEVLGPTVDRLAALQATVERSSSQSEPDAWPSPWPSEAYPSPASSCPVR